MSTTLLWHGHVYSPADPFATAMLVNDGVVAWVGADGAASVHVDDVDEVVELDGALVTPAFVDAHVHLTATGLTLLGLDLSQTRSLGEALDAVAAATRAEQGGVLLISRTPYLRPIAWISCWPSTLPVSAKPDGISTAPGTFFSPHSVSAAATNFAGIANTATSTGPGTSLTLL